MSSIEVVFCVLGIMATLAITAMVADVTWCAVKALRELSRRERERQFEAGWMDGFREGAATDDKTRRIGERARRLGR